MDFWSAVKSGQEPNKDPERDLYLPKGAAEPHWQQLAANFRQNAAKIDEFKTQLKALELQQAGIEQTLVGLMGDFMAAEHSGLRVSRFQMQGCIDYKAVLSAQLPELQEAALEAYRKKPSNRVRITCRDDDGKRAEVPFDAEVLKDLARVDYWF
jgi:hypothetical protein